MLSNFVCHGLPNQPQGLGAFLPDYRAALDLAIEVERSGHGHKPLKEKEREPQVKETKVDRTNSESGYIVRKDKPKGVFYLDHRTVDGRHTIMTDTHLTPANVHDRMLYLERLGSKRERFGFDAGAVGLFAGYATTIRPLPGTA